MGTQLYHQCFATRPFSVHSIESLSQKLFLSLSPFSKGCSRPPASPLSLSLDPLFSLCSLHPSIHPPFLPFLPAPASPPTPTTPNMCFSDTPAGTWCFSKPQDRQSITAWLSLSIGSEPPLAQPFGAGVGVLIGHKGIGVCVGLSSG